MREKSLTAILLLNAAVCAATEIEIPVYPGSSIEYEESMQSSRECYKFCVISVICSKTGMTHV